MTYILVVMAFMNTVARDNWHIPIVVKGFNTSGACEAVGQAMQEMEKRTKYKCVAVTGE